MEKRGNKEGSVETFSPRSKMIATRGWRRGRRRLHEVRSPTLETSRRKGLKRPNAPVKYDTSRRVKRRTEEKVASSPAPSSSGESSDEPSSGVASEEEMVFKEPSMYDNLLYTLGTGSESLANAYKRRQRDEEGRSDTEEDTDGGPESLTMSEEEDNEEGTGNESARVHANGSIMEQGEDAETEDDEASNPDEMHDQDDEASNPDVDGQSAVGASECMSSFTIHLGHKLSKEEVDNLTRRKWKYDWETPAFDMPSCRWMGTGESFPKDANTSSSYGLKQKLRKHWLESYKTSGGDDFHSSKQRSFFSLCNSYRDILHCNKKPFYLKGQEEDSCIMDAYIMHALNHIFRTSDLVTKNDAKVTKHQETIKEEILTGESFLDHGFTRPKVLIILPLASIALRVVKRLIQLTPSSCKVNVDHIERFSAEFGAGVVEDDQEQNEFSQKVQYYENSKAQKSSKPSDFQAFFGANNNDHFMIGIKFTRRTIKLYGDFYSSDMIIASPLGLITKIGEAEVEKEKDVDYLSSIEVLVIDHADVISMQNWSHVNSVVEQLNRIPSKQHGTDIMRIRQWYLDGHARFYRQTIILGSYLTPDINALFNHHCVNYEGKMKLVCEYKGALAKVLLQVRQIYERFDADSIVDSDDARFEYFTKKVFPKIKDSIQGGIMLFVSSYFEYVRIRNFLKSQNASFCLLGEYTKQSDISRARVWFFEGKRKIMLYTERAHFYHRYKIRGIQNLIIYSLPERKEFYPEIVNMLEGSHNMTCTVLFSRFDQFRLERIVGTRPAKRMVASEKNVFVFC